MRINQYVPGVQTLDAVSRLPSGGFLVAWSGDTDPPRAGDRVSARFLDEYGEPYGEDMLVSFADDVDTHTYFQRAYVASNEAGRIVIAWASGSAAYFQLLDISGEKIGDSRLIGDWEFDPKVAVAPDGSFVVVTYDLNTIPGMDRYYNRQLLRRYSPEGTLLFGPVPIDEETRFQRQADVAMDSQGNFIVVYSAVEGEPPPLYESSETDIFAQRFAHDCTPIGGRFRVNEDLLGWQRYPTISMDSRGRFVVVWTCSDWGLIFMRRFDEKGNPIGHDDEVTYPPWYRSVGGGYAGTSYPNLDMNDSGRIAVAWHTTAWDEWGDVVVRIIEFDATDFLRGDANSDGDLSVADVISILSYLFAGGKEPDPLDAADVNDSGVIDLSDAIYLLGYLFAGNPKYLPHPHPYYGFDPTPDDL